MSQIFNNLRDPVHINIANPNKVVELEGADNFKKTSETLTIQPGSVASLSGQEVIMYIFSHDTKLNVDRTNIFEADLSKKPKIMIGERVFSKLRFNDMDAYRKFNPDEVFGMSYIIPDRITYSYGLVYLFVVLLIILIPAIILVVIMLNY